MVIHHKNRFYLIKLFKNFTLIYMNISEQPGRFCAIFVFGPLLIYKGKKYNDKLLKIFGIVFIVYEIFWVLFHNPKKILI